MRYLVLSGAANVYGYPQGRTTTRTQIKPMRGKAPTLTPHSPIEIDYASREVLRNSKIAWAAWTKYLTAAI